MKQEKGTALALAGPLATARGGGLGTSAAGGLSQKGVVLPTTIAVEEDDAGAEFRPSKA